MIFHRIVLNNSRLIRLFSTSYESSYEMVIDRLSSEANKASFSANKSWNHLINDLIELKLPCYSDHQKKSIQRSINYRLDIHRGNYGPIERVFSLRKQFESSLSEDNVDGFILRAIRDLGDPELGINYLKFLQNSSSYEPSLTHKLLVLEAAGRSPTPISKENVEKEILSIAQETQSCIDELNISDQNIFYVIGAYSNTSKWLEKGLPLFLSTRMTSPEDDLEERVTRSSVTAGQCLALRVLRENGATPNFWSIIDNTNFITNNFQLRYVQLGDIQNSHDLVYSEYINSSKSIEDIELLFKFMRKHWCLVSWDVARALKNKLEGQASLKVEEMSNRGNCKSCSGSLQSDEFQKDDLKNLREAVYEKCLKKSDIYLSSLPDEVRRFDRFIASLSKFDVVVDGLNVALSHLPKFQEGSLTKSKVGRKMILTQSKNILGVLNTLRNRGLKNIVLIHRDGIERFPDYNEIRSLSYIYTAKRDSQDDPFILLATLSSGLGTLFVSNDRLRQHNYLLEEPRLQRLFTRWQLAHQCFHKVWVTPDKAQGRMNYRYVVTHPHSFEIRAQESKGVWHIPLLHKYNEDKGHLSVPKHWLCIDFNRT